MPENNGKQGFEGHKFSTFTGVFTPSILTIFGVIMFMRACYVTGYAGVYGALVILLVATSITFATSLSISAVSTNTPVKGGGAYFLISRALGPEFGASIGIALFIAQSLSVPFYILGFVEALVMNFPSLGNYYLYLLLITCTVLFIMSWVGADWAMKCQFIIMAILGMAILTFLGAALLKFDTVTLNTNLKPAKDVNFFRIFAIYFPAVTGIMAGVNMSGDLKNPSKSIPAGTLSAVLVGAIVYALQIFLCGGAYGRDTLIQQPYMVLVDNALFGMGFIIVAGVWSASLSSAIGSFLGAPRVCQALASDRIIPFIGFLGKGSGKHNEPRAASMLTFFISIAVLFWAGYEGLAEDGISPALNIVAAVVTMFFLYTYGMVNLAAFVESFGANPSFRPRFRFSHWSASLFGAVACLIVSFLINPGVAFVSFLIIGGLFYVVSKLEMEKTFGDARRGFIYSRIRKSLLDLSSIKSNPKNWRPTIVVFTGNPRTRLSLLKYACLFECGRGIVSMVEILTGSFDKLKDTRKMEIEMLKKLAADNNFCAFPEVVMVEDFDQGLRTFLQSHSIGPIKPNIAMFGWPSEESRVAPFLNHINTVANMEMSCIIHIDQSGKDTRVYPGRYVDIWWRGQKNGSLMLILAYLLSRNSLWGSVKLRILRTVNSEEGRVPAFEDMKRLVDEARLDAEIKILISDEPFINILKRESGSSIALFMGFLPPEKEKFMNFYNAVNNMTTQMPPAFLVHSSGDADLNA